AGVVLFALGVRHLLTLFTLMLAVLAIGLIVGEFWLPVKARRRNQGEGWRTALATVVNKNRRRHGGYVVHLGVIVMAV
ncbi:MAG: heme lyase CcmF/NrfE family subunit, partial [Gemmatimonadetes bacterium]|nr:heme lyase CcmF/NrfE family subunit [Gemmatimonadota bacterium]NIS00963.1 heme lyase CcmF/NrfE family subunit [Gemmatimonadota bacterium]NIT66590.1 heme lyase CcmF/NrfE family subunit [Gemmatimonadota bacterium]NIU53153.1 heme lyase CcmF/NrfE family subunit [Gemmatimonadota bacterium]NIV23118.1 heme lyase CcmF/NrfE family subunit [Gemmatimonadota bacterium]